MQATHQDIDQHGQSVDQVELLKHKAHLRANAAHIAGNVAVALHA